jgi:hypothetical protein
MALQEGIKMTKLGKEILVLCEETVNATLTRVGVLVISRENLIEACTLSKVGYSEGKFRCTQLGIWIL